MNNRHVEAFRAVMLAGTVTGGSQLLNISQPAVSRLIAHLEAELGFGVFDRSRGRLVPTPEGLLFYEEVQRSYVGLTKLAEAAAAIRDFRDGQIRVATLAAFSTHLVPAFVGKFSESLPGVNFQVHVTTPERIRAGIAEQQYHVGLVSLPVNHPSIKVEFYVTTSLVCVIPIGHRFEKRDEVDMDDLLNEPLIIVPREYPLRLAIDTEFQKRGRHPDIKAETTISMAACGLVQHGLGVAITEPFTPIMFQKMGGITVKPFSRAFNFRFAVVTSGIRSTPRLIQQFVSRLRRHIEEFQLYPDLKIDLKIDDP
jgi:DNA-binding transcriptional LysR family regulator